MNNIYPFSPRQDLVVMMVRGPSGMGNREVSDLILGYLKTVESCKVEDLLSLIKKQHHGLDLSEIDIIDAIRKLDEEERIDLTQPSFSSFTSFLSTPVWSLDIWLVTIVVVFSLMSFFLIPAQQPFVYLRAGLGLAFLLYLPGYSLVEFIFPLGRGADKFEKIALRVALSIAVVFGVGLFLSLTPLGLRLEPIVATMAGVTLLLMGSASYKKYNLFFQARNQNERVLLA